MSSTQTPDEVRAAQQAAKAGDTPQSASSTDAINAARANQGLPPLRWDHDTARYVALPEPVDEPTECESCSSVATYRCRPDEATVTRYACDRHKCGHCNPLPPSPATQSETDRSSDVGRHESKCAVSGPCMDDGPDERGYAASHRLRRIEQCQECGEICTCSEPMSVAGEPQPQRYRYAPINGDWESSLNKHPDGEWVRWSDVAHLYGQEGGR